MMTNSNKQQPTHKVQFGNIKVTVWTNSNEQGKEYFNFILSRSYKDSDDVWQEQKISFQLNEASKIIGVLNKAQEDFYTLPKFKNISTEQTETSNAPAKPAGNY